MSTHAEAGTQVASNDKQAGGPTSHRIEAVEQADGEREQWKAQPQRRRRGPPTAARWYPPQPWLGLLAWQSGWAGRQATNGSAAGVVGMLEHGEETGAGGVIVLGIRRSVPHSDRTPALTTEGLVLREPVKSGANASRSTAMSKQDAEVGMSPSEKDFRRLKMGAAGTYEHFHIGPAPRSCRLPAL
ncbi:MAG: hypothetical protein MRJ92_01545 [Nitrospira sp.]|nr:hypothetical protein [Nitrospira sp.]